LSFNRKNAIYLAIVTLLIGGLIGFTYWLTPPTIIIGSKNFTEQVILENYWLNKLNFILN